MNFDDNGKPIRKAPKIKPNNPSKIIIESDGHTQSIHIRRLKKMARANLIYRDCNGRWRFTRKFVESGFDGAAACEPKHKTVIRGDEAFPLSFRLPGSFESNSR